MTRRKVPASAIKTTLFTAVAAALFLGLIVIVGNLSFTPTHGYSAIFTDATSLSSGSAVRLAGVEVGTVQSIGLVTGDGHRYAKVAFNVDTSVPLYRTAEIDLRYDNLVGNRYLAIVERPGAALMREGGQFPRSQTKPALNLTDLFNGFQPLFTALTPDQVNTLALEIVQTLQGEGGTIAALLANTAKFTTAIADKDAVIGDVVTNLTTVLTTVDERDASLTSLINEFRNLMTGLADDRSTIDSSLPDLANLLTSTSSLITEIRQPLKGSIAAVNAFAGSVAQTTDQLNQALHALAAHTNAYTRLASYGSWFNFYLCGADARLTLLGQSVQLNSPVGAGTTQPGTVCSGGQ